MAKKSPPKMVHCKYPKCKFLHEKTELLREEAVKGGKGSSYYHPDCYYTMQTVCAIRDKFYQEVNPLLTGKQIGQLVSIINNLVFMKKVSVDYILFAVEYYIKNKPGALKFPAGISYIIQDKDVEAAWKKEQSAKISAEIREQRNRSLATTNDVTEIGIWDSSEEQFTYTPSKSRGFADILR